MRLSRDFVGIAGLNLRTGRLIILFRFIRAVVGVTSVIFRLCVRTAIRRRPRKIGEGEFKIGFLVALPSKLYIMFIKLTNLSGDTVHVNANHVAIVEYVSDGETKLVMSGGRILSVKEPVGAVMEWIENYFGSL